MENTEKIKLLIVDDHPIMRVGIAAIINARADMVTVAQAGTGESALELAVEHLLGLAGFALGERFANADDRLEAGGKGGAELASDRFVGFAEKLAALGVADDDARAARFDEHRRGDFAGERALRLPVEILRGDRDGRAARGFDGGGERGEPRRDDDAAMRGAGDERQKRAEKPSRFRPGLEHLPVAGDHRHARRSSGHG